MKFFKRLTVFLLVTVFVMSTFAGCGSGNTAKAPQSTVQAPQSTAAGSDKEAAQTEKKEPIKLTYLCANENYADNFKELVADYEKMSGNKVDVQLFPATEYDKIIRTKMMSAQNFDLYRTDAIKMAESFWPKDWPEDLSNRPWVSRLTPSAKIIIGWSDKKITGLPITNNGGFGIMYNKDIFDRVGIKELPKTWKEFLDVCEKIKTAGITPVNIQLANGSEFGTTHLMHQLFANIYISHKDVNGEIFAKLDSNQLKFADVPEFEQALNQIVELKNKGYINKDFISNTFEMTQDKFGKGEVAMHPCGDFILQPMLGKYPNLKVGFFPAPFGDTQGAIAGYSGVGLSVSSKAKYKEDALKFMDFFASKEEQDKYMAKSPGIGVFSDVKTVDNMISADMAKWADNEKVYPGIFESLQVWPEMDARKIMQELLLGVKTPKQMLQDIDKKSEIIAKGKKLSGW